MTNQLSPAAQAVLDAVCDNTEPDCDTQHLIAAALRAAADLVVPEEQEPVPNEDSVLEMQMWARVSQRQRTRSQLLTIADELEGAND